MCGKKKQYRIVLMSLGIAAFGLVSLACKGVFQPYYQFIQKIDCEASGGQWKEDQYNDVFLGYYCENAGLKYNQKYFPTATPIESPLLEPSTSQEPTSSTTQGTSPTATPPPVIGSSPLDPYSSNIPGLWHGTAQWLCDTNPVWSTSLEFKPNGSVSATVSNTSDTASADGSWEVSENEVRLLFERGLWVGIISGNTINGTFAEKDCDGVWSVMKD